MDVSTAVGFRQRPLWLLIVAALLFAQGWLTLRLFTFDSQFDSLTDDRPLVSGRHPLHFYHGLLGAQTWKDHGTSCCFDPAYQAGYPKTPVFDGGSRPAEFAQMIGGSHASAYKLALAIGCLLVPLAFIIMGRGIDLPPGRCCLAGLLGGILWWSEPCQALLLAGDMDLLLGGICVLLHITWFVRFERDPGMDSWLMMTFFAALAWYTQPLLVVGFLPFLLLYYLWVATRQGAIWHLAIIAAVLFAFGLNAIWLIDWAKNLWVYLPGGEQLAAPAPFWPTLAQNWSSLLPGDPIHIGIAITGLLGLLLMLRANAPAAWLLAFGTLEYVLVAASGKFWPMLTDFGAEKFLLIASWCLVLPAAMTLTVAANRLGRSCGWRPLGSLALIGALAVIVWFIDLPQQASSQPRLEIGLNPDRESIVKELRERTTAEARILWEDRPGEGWTALLALQTERPFLGGLDPNGHIEHMYARLAEGKLGGKPLDEWTDGHIAEFCDRYNIGWAVCWTKESIDRFRRLPFAKPVSELNDNGPGFLFVIERKRSYFLKGRGDWVVADAQRIALANIVPEDGEVVLSMHYQSKMRISPSYVQIERDIDLDDPIPFIRLRVPGPVARVSISWDNP